MANEVTDTTRGKKLCHCRELKWPHYHFVRKGYSPLQQYWEQSKMPAWRTGDIADKTRRMTTYV